MPSTLGNSAHVAQSVFATSGLHSEGRPCRRTAKAPLGYTLPAFPWYIDQTVGGAVSTGTHGSSLQFGSLSSQARPPAHRSSIAHESACQWSAP